MTDELGREELLHYFEKVCSYCPHLKRPESENYCIEYEQAYEQIKALIQKPEIDEAWIEEKACEASRFYSVSCKTVADSRNFIRQLYDEMPTKKVTVTEKEVFDFHNNLTTIETDSESQEESYDREIDYIANWLIRKGVEVVKK